MKTNRPVVSSRPIQRFDKPARGPHHNPPSGTGQRPSNATAAQAIRKAKNPGQIDPKQQHN